MSLPRVWLPEVAIENDAETLAISFFQQPEAMQRQAQLWYAGTNPFNLKRIVPENSRWWTLGGQYGWTKSLDYLRRRAECDAAYAAWQAREATRTAHLRELEADWGVLVREAQVAIMQRSLDGASTVALGCQWEPVRRVPTNRVALCGHACVLCFAILPEWQPGMGAFGNWSGACHGSDQIMSEVFEFDWVAWG